MTKFLPKTTASITCAIYWNARDEHGVGTYINIRHSSRWLSHQDQPFQWTSLEICVCDVTRLDREAFARNPWKEDVQPFDVTGWRVRSHTSGFLQISGSDQSTLEQWSNMRTTFAPFMLVFVDFDPLEWNRFVSLNQQLFQFGSRYWIYSIKNVSTCPIQPCGIPSNLTA